MTTARVSVACAIEITLETSATDDEQFLAEVAKHPDVRDALAALVGSAMDYRESDKERRKTHKIQFTRLMLEPREIGWSTI